MNALTDVSTVWDQFLATRDSASRDELIVHYLPVVKSIVGKLGLRFASILDQDDLTSCGTMGLMESVERFDPGHGVKFTTFATRRIQGAIIDQTRAQDWMSRSSRQRDKAIVNATNELREKLGRNPGAKEVADSLGLTEARYNKAMQTAGVVTFSLDTILRGNPEQDHPHTMADGIEDRSLGDPGAGMESRELLDILSSEINRLPEREKSIIKLYFVEGKNLQEIGDDLNRSASRVSQILMRTLDKLRFSLRRDLPQFHELLAAA